MTVIRIGATFAPARATDSDAARAVGSLAPAAATSARASLPSTVAISIKRSAEEKAILFAYGIVAVGLLLSGLALAVAKPPTFVPTADFDAFALLYIFAQGIERLIEPLAAYVKGPSPKGDDGKDEAKGDGGMTKAKAKEARALAIQAALTAADEKTKQEQTEKARQAQEAIDQARANAAYIMWGVATLLGLLASAVFGLQLLAGVGATFAPQILDIWVTGLIIGAGTKPLHDLIETIRTPKEKQEQSEASTESCCA